MVTSITTWEIDGKKVKMFFSCLLYEIFVPLLSNIVGFLFCTETDA